MAFCKSAPGEIDLHGLYVKEAIARTDEAILAAKRRGDSQLRLVVGKGIHSQGGVAKIKPAIAELMQKYVRQTYLSCSILSIFLLLSSSHSDMHC